MLGYAANNSRIRGSTPSTINPIPVRRYAGTPVDRPRPTPPSPCSSRSLEIPINRAITLIGNRSAGWSPRISAQSSTCNTRFLPTSKEASISEGVSFQLPLGDQFSRASVPASPGLARVTSPVRVSVAIRGSVRRPVCAETRKPALSTVESTEVVYDGAPFLSVAS